MENEYDDHVGPPSASAIGIYTDLAVKAGLARQGDKLDQSMIDFASALVDQCAAIGDRYTLPENEANAGEHIRAELLP